MAEIKTVIPPEEGAKFVDKVRIVFRKFLGVDAPAKTTEYIRAEDARYLALLQTMQKWFQDILQGGGTRQDKYDKYKYLDDNLAEASSSLNVYADNIVSGTVGGDENFKVVIDEKTSGIEKLEKIVSEGEKRLGIKDDIWDIARDQTSFGDVFEEVVIVQRDGEMYLEKLKPLPEKEMSLDVDERGVLKNPEKPYTQKPSGSTVGIPFDEWRVIHFKIGRRLYGVDRSIFAGAAQRIGRQLLWVDECLVLARLSRAWMRYAFLVDTKGLSPEQAFDFVDKFMEKVKRREVIDRVTGKISMLDNMLLPDEDIGIPVSADSKTAVQTLSGDMNLGNIFDVQYLQNKFLMAVTMPKAYVSLEEGVSTKATLSQIDVQFARQVRRRQQALIPGLRKLYRLMFILAGVDPDSFVWDIVFPGLATADELVKWQIEQIKAGIARTYFIEMGAVNLDYVLKEILGFDDEKMKKYSPAIGDGGGLGQIPPDMQLPPETASLIRKDPHIRQMLEDLKDLIHWRLTREEKLIGKKEVGIQREEPLRDKWK